MPEPDPVATFLDRLAASLVDDTFVRLVLSRPRGDGDVPHRILARRVDVRGRGLVSLTQRFSTRDEVENLEEQEFIEWAKGRLVSGYRSALLCTTQKDWQLSIPPDAPSRLVAHQPAVTKAPDRSHDRTKATFLGPAASDWLQPLGVLDEAGKVRASMADKHRQIDRYLEILSHLVKDCGWPPGQPVTLADMGCGKGYLTFGAWHLLNRSLQIPARVVGVEQRANLVEATSRIAREIGADNLTFVRGAIEDAVLPPLDALIALHACDMATDAAILRGVRHGARLILVAPCCHHELRPQLSHPEPFDPVLRHGLMKERMAEWLTDALRALHLEWAGYRTRIFEFVSLEHTSKNVMISAVKTGPAFVSEDIRDSIGRLKTFFGVGRLALDELPEGRAGCAPPAATGNASPAPGAALPAVTP